MFRRAGRFGVIDEVSPRENFVLSAECIECEPTSYKWRVNTSTDVMSTNSTYRSSATLADDTTYLFTVEGIEVALPQNYTLAVPCARACTCVRACDDVNST